MNLGALRIYHSRAPTEKRGSTCSLVKPLNPNPLNRQTPQSTQKIIPNGTWGRYRAHVEMTKVYPFDIYIYICMYVYTQTEKERERERERERYIYIYGFWSQSHITKPYNINLPGVLRGESGSGFLI